MAQKIFDIALSDHERQQLHTYVNTGIHSARSINRARTLLFADDGKTDPWIAEHVGVCKATVFNIRRRYCTEGLDATLIEKPRAGAPRRLNGADEACLTTLACSQPPDGRQRWTIRLLRDRLIALEVVETISKSTVQQWLKKTS